MGMIKEFREFAMKGNVIDMAVGIVIGGAFGTIVKSLVDHIIMPPIGYVTGKVDFANLAVELPTDGDPVKIQYGMFINAVISFIIIAFALFIVIKWMNTIQRQFEEKKAEPDPTTKKCPECLMEIPIAATKCGHCTSVIAQQ